MIQIIQKTIMYTPYVFHESFTRNNLAFRVVLYALFSSNVFWVFEMRNSSANFSNKQVKSFLRQKICVLIEMYLLDTQQRNVASFVEVQRLKQFIVFSKCFKTM